MLALAMPLSMAPCIPGRSSRKPYGPPSSYALAGGDVMGGGEHMALVGSTLGGNASAMREEEDTSLLPVSWEGAGE